MTMNIRSAVSEDAERLLEIYGYYVLNTAITFEIELPSLSEFTERIENTLKKYPYLVAEDEGRIKGYAYAGPFVGRAAYDHCCELTVYLDHNERKKGCGRALYEAMEERLKALGYLNLYACIGDPVREDEYLTRNSEEFHAHMGFKRVGKFTECGYKFGRFYNMIWMEKLIGDRSLIEGGIRNED